MVGAAFNSDDRSLLQHAYRTHHWKTQEASHGGFVNRIGTGYSGRLCFLASPVLSHRASTDPKLGTRITYPMVSMSPILCHNLSHSPVRRREAFYLKLEQERQAAIEQE